MDKNARIYVAGHTGMVGSAIVRKLEAEGFLNLLLKTHSELDLLDQEAVKKFFEENNPEYVFIAAAKVGGIHANNTYRAQFIYENLQIQNNLIHYAYESGVKKLLFLGSSCIYPRNAPQPMKEEYLLSGELEATNEPYALAKIAGLKMIECYRKQYNFPGISVMPCNLYGTNDSFDLENCHVLSALIKKFVDAVGNQTESVIIWGSGKAKREFMHVEDAAKAIIFMIENYDDDQFINVGWGKDICIFDLANMIAELTGYKGKIECDHSQPDGILRKCLDVSRMNDVGFSPEITLRDGIVKTIEEYKAMSI
jgi:GDP-L-fucose synthase